jgi:hypothetical protein
MAGTATKTRRQIPCGRDVASLVLLEGVTAVAPADRSPRMLASATEHGEPGNFVHATCPCCNTNFEILQCISLYTAPEGIRGSLRAFAAASSFSGGRPSSSMIAPTNPATRRLFSLANQEPSKQGCYYPKLLWRRGEGEWKSTASRMFF